MAVAVAGNVDHDAVVRWVSRSFAREGFLDGSTEPVVPRQSLTPRRIAAATAETTRAFEQVNLVLGVQGLTRSDDRRFTLGVLSTALGGGTSSRLFQEVRERRGLAYGVYSFSAAHADAGLVGVSVGCLPAKLDAVLAVVRGELAAIARDGITAEELARGQGQLTRGLLMGMEDSASRMTRLGKAEILDDRLIPLEQVLARIDGVTLDDVHRLAAALFVQPEVLAVVGPLA
jgi:predicted Zn-dependent peptidase